MAEALYELTPEEEQLMIASTRDPNLFFQYWFERPDGAYFQLDHGFDDNPWQVDFCMAEQSTLVAICGVATGKTLATGMSAIYHCSVTPHFRFLNVGHELSQARFMYDEVTSFMENTRFQKLVVKSSASPHPIIEIAYLIRGVKVWSTFECNSAGEKSDAKNLLSWRGDWINIEECGRFDNLEDVRTILRTRLTGSTASGRPYMGRLSLISNPIDNPEMWEIFNKAQEDPDSLTFLIDTASNKNVTDKQIRAQLVDIPEEDQDLWLKGERPEGRGSYFQKHTVESCSSEIMSIKLKEGIAAGIPGFHGEYTPSLGYWHFRFPYDKDRQYMVIGDPGTGRAPLRNAPCIIVLDTFDAPKVNKIVAMWWGNGVGKISPFTNMFLDFLDVYKPVYAAIDSTATQKNYNEVMNTEFVYDGGYSVEAITGMDFSVSRKDQYLVSSRLVLEMTALIWPDCAKGIGSQLKSYDRVKDTAASTSKLAQDIVACISMASFASRRLYPPERTTEDQDDEKKSKIARTRSSRSGILRARRAVSGGRRRTR